MNVSPYLIKEYNLRTSDFDLYARVRPRTLLDIMQDAAGDHAIELGCGITQLPSRGLAWVLTKTRYDFLENPEMHRKVLVKTWPLRPGKFTYRRDCRIETMDGRVVCNAASEWVIMDFKERKLKMVEDIYPQIEPLNELAYDKTKLGRIPSVTDPFLTTAVSAAYMDQDTNFHVNNIVYADYIMNMLKPSDKETIRHFEIDYHKEVKASEEIHLSAQYVEDGVLVDGVSHCGERLFNSFLSYK